MNRPGDSRRRTTDPSSYSGRLPSSSTTGFASQRKPLKVNKDGIKGNTFVQHKRNSTFKQPNSQMIVPIPGKYKNYSQKSDNSDVATPSISSTEVDNTASSHNSIQPRVVESHEFASDGAVPAEAKEEVKAPSSSVEDSLKRQAQEQDDAELRAIEMEQKRRLEDEEKLRQMEINKVTSHRINNYGNARVVNNNPNIADPPHTEYTRPQRIFKPTRYNPQTHRNPSKHRHEPKPEPPKKNFFTLGEEDTKIVQSQLNSWKSVTYEPFTQIDETHYNYGVNIFDDTVYETPQQTSSLQGFAEVPPSPSDVSGLSGVSTMSGVSGLSPGPMLAGQPNYMIPMNAMYPGITYIQPVYPSDFYFDYVWPQQGMAWTVPSGMAQAGMAYAAPVMPPGQQYSYTIPTGETSA